MRSRSRSGVVVLFAVALAGCAKGGADLAPTVVAVADRPLAPVLAGASLEAGDRLDTSELRGAPLVINIWGSWCVPCRAEQPQLVRVARDTAALGVRFLGVDVRDPSRPSALGHVHKFGVTYPSLYDVNSVLVARLRSLPANAVPSTLVLDRRGRIAVTIIGATSYAELYPLVVTVAKEVVGS